MIHLILLFTSFITVSQTNPFYERKSCDICIIDSQCTDDKIYFNISISKDCPVPLRTHFTYFTDVNSKLIHYNTTSTCSNCYINAEIEPVRNAWDYTLTLKSPKRSENCPTEHVAHCAGDTFRLSWFILGGLSVLTVLLGALLCSIKHCRGQMQTLPMKTKITEVTPLNA